MTIETGNNITYTQKMRITRLLYHCIIAQNNWRAFLPKGFTNNHEVNTRFTLAELLDESIENINSYLCHSEYLTDYALISVAASGKGGGFFKEAQKVKRNIIKELRHEGKSDQYIRDCVSGEVLKMAAEFDITGKIRKWHERESIGACEMTESRTGTRLGFGRQTLRLKKRSDTLDTQKGCSPIKIKKELIEIGKQLKNIPVHTGQDFEQTAEGVKASIVSLSKLYQKILFLANQKPVQEDKKEAA